ncbi:MAG: RNA polymerase factor sigma-54 [Verrucomicrobiaceae bacterium]|nr:RNA polymerase factor sigma-54 [Verrucomicrobiaceae bacterium]
MAEHGLYLTQTQKQVIGPQMQQSLQLLQAPTLELRQIIQQELAVNPVLEMESPEVSLEDTGPDDPEDDRDLDKLSEMDEEWREYWAQSRTPVTRRDDDDERYRYVMDSIVASTTLQEHLLEQLRTNSDISPEVREQVEFLIGSLDDHGFLGTTLGDLSLNHSIPMSDLEAAYKVLTSFDPVGIGAVDLRESLLIQLRRLGKVGTLPYRFVEEAMDDLANKRYPILARRYGVPLEQVSRAADFIGTLDPRPASRFTEGSNHYVSPDIYVERSGGQWVAVMSQEELPRLRISNAYKDMIAEGGTHSDVREYIREKIRSGKFLIRSVQQRQATIHRIATEVIKHQQEFLDKGRAHLRPLSMSQIADEIGVHETTVSRAIAGKYIATPHGVVELKFFFTQGLKTESGEDLSNTSVKNAVAELIKTEKARKPLSDDKIATLLKAQGIHVARRTVAKYREALGILPSHLRKSFS